MSFEINSWDQDTYISLQGLVNKNNGFWRSAKQAKFAPKHMELRNDYDFMEQHFGFRAPEGTQVAPVGVTYTFSDLRGRSVIPGIVFFVLDEYGVVARYKVGGNGNSRDGWAPNPKKCKVEFERSADAELPDWSKERSEMDAADKAEADRLAARPELKAGRYTLVGKVLNTKSVFSPHAGYSGGYVYKMLVELDNGNKVYGSIPSSIDANRGDRVQFDAKVTVSDDDEHFGFYSRPTKASIIEVE